MMYLATLLLCSNMAALSPSTHGKPANAFTYLYKMRFEQVDVRNVWRLECNKYGMYSASNIKLYSNNIKCFLDLYRIYDKKIQGNCYLLFDEENNTFLDDIEFGDIAHGKSVFIYSNRHNPELKEIRNAYLHWAGLIRENGIDYVLHKKISPLAGTKYRWVKV